MSSWTAFLAAASTWKIPEFPLRGRDLVGKGIAAGPQVGDLLDALESWWIARDFKPDRRELLIRAQRQLAPSED